MNRQFSTSDRNRNNRSANMNSLASCRVLPNSIAKFSVNCTSKITHKPRSPSWIPCCQYWKKPNQAGHSWPARSDEPKKKLIKQKIQGNTCRRSERPTVFFVASFSCCNRKIFFTPNSSPRFAEFLTPSKYLQMDGIRMVFDKMKE